MRNIVVKLVCMIIMVLIINVLVCVLIRMNQYKNIQKLNPLENDRFVANVFDKNVLIDDINDDKFINGKVKNKFITKMYYDNSFDDFLKNILVNNSSYIRKVKWIRKDINNNLKYYPILVNSSLKNNKDIFTFDNSWGMARSYGGDRTHEGVDIMYSNNKRDEVPIVSISDGVIVKKGWLKLGGYRLYIKSSENLYFYYAHLSAYENNINEGDKVYAGQIIGYMGDSGYGEEGTKGKFPVHLHFGVYYKDDNGNEKAINPYFLLKFLENYKLSYQKS